MTGILDSRLVDRAVEVKFEDGKLLSFEDCWLRDHCQCTTCYHAHTFQRALHLLDIPDSNITNVNYVDGQLEVIWDDNHRSSFKPDFLRQFDYGVWKEKRRLKFKLWRGKNVGCNITRTHVDKFLNTKEGAKMIFQSLLDYGVALIEGVKPTLEATEEVCLALGGVQHTLFGGMWQFTTKADHADTAYTNLPLATHNDNTYFTEAAGLQILHCIEHSNGKGGETVLVDGFYGAKQLKEDHPDDFEFLTTFNVEAEYIEEGHHHKFAAPVIQLDSESSDPKQIRFNVYDRSAMAFKDKEQCRSYYRSLRNLANYYQDPNNQWQFKLNPGTVMVMDNFRILHGRTGFSGNRVLCGCYVARSDWLNRARVMNLIY